MGKPSVFECSNCHATQTKWHGKCPSCGQFDTFHETSVRAEPSRSSLLGNGQGRVRRSNVTLTPTSLSEATDAPVRESSGLVEVDRVLGGGIVEGSAILLAGTPGIGKSTLLLQIAAHAAQSRHTSYFSGEESRNQIRQRAVRLGLQDCDLVLDSTSDALAIADYIDGLPPNSMVIIDSLQTLHCGGDSSPGSVSQVRDATNILVPIAKDRQITLILVSHTTKDGTIAGPNTIVHTVDCLLYLDTDLSSGMFRILRTEKNRFGATDEVGILSMTEAGLKDVLNPSEIFISQRDPTSFGTAIFPSLEGSRPLLVEVQALVAPTSFGTGRRSATGWDTNRLNMLLATISSRIGISLLDQDVYVNVAGGMRITDPAMDLAVACAILSSAARVVLPENLAVFGEIGLAGEVRNAARPDPRIRESQRLGFRDIIVPRLANDAVEFRDGKITQIRRVSQLLEAIPPLKSLLE